jgi:hypothetical protein
LKGDVPAMLDGRIIGHEAVGTVTQVGGAVKNVRWATVFWCRAAAEAAGGPSSRRASMRSPPSWMDGPSAHRHGTLMIGDGVLE